MLIRAEMPYHLKQIVTESFAVTEMTAAAGAVLFRFGSKGSGFHVSERPESS